MKGMGVDAENASERAQASEELLLLLRGCAAFPVWTPLFAFEAAAILSQFLQAEEARRDAAIQ